MSQLVGVTGAYGLLGWHLRCYLRSLPDLEIIVAGRDEFASSEKLEAFVSGCDVVVHLAGMNRGDEQEVASTNVVLTQKLIAALESANTRPHVVFSSSTHIFRETLYGASKRQSAQLLSDWAQRSGGKFTNLVLPGVFGEGGKPFYNSVVSTFCHQVALGEQPTIQQDGQMEQIHAQSVARLIWDAVTQGREGEIRIDGQAISVTGLLERLTHFKTLYDQNIIPDVRQEFDRDLFNTYRSYLYPNRYPVALKVHSDDRGGLFEAVKTHNGGQTFFSSTHPGITRGNHFHTRKIERFLVVGGEAEIRLRRVFSDEVQVFRVNGTTPSYVDIPTLHTHNIRNVGSSEVTTLFWTHELFDPANPDTIMEMVEP